MRHRRYYLTFGQDEYDPYHIRCVRFQSCEVRSKVLGCNLAGVHNVVGWRKRLVGKPCIQHVKDTLLVTRLHSVRNSFQQSKDCQNSIVYFAINMHTVVVITNKLDYT